MVEKLNIYYTIQKSSGI